MSAPMEAAAAVRLMRERIFLEVGELREVFYRDRALLVRSCRVCGCTDDDCSGCVEKTGVPCSWLEEDLCSACGAVEVQP